MTVLKPVFLSSINRNENLPEIRYSGFNIVIIKRIQHNLVCNETDLGIGLQGFPVGFAAVDAL